MKVLHLTLKKKWFDMILSGEKKEEYREIKPYWIKRLTGKCHDVISFTNGYSKNAPNFRIELKYIVKGFGIVEWGAKEVDMVYILRLGRILNKKECEVAK